ncbi:hypothetical protein ANCCEY_01358 [Ancylostoma ceylanicum]|uniref:Uncharacterized protein n=1 Tax=Ancylostoma ceylanicum TaxID=53326 RepID=A0A0D6M7S8_9BILA|nr:hypothetical protein ANCCEY_01358 [Ancylostoma ceylanicum]
MAQGQCIVENGEEDCVRLTETNKKCMPDSCLDILKGLDCHKCRNSQPFSEPITSVNIQIQGKRAREGEEEEKAYSSHISLTHDGVLKNMDAESPEAHSWSHM